MDDVIEHSKTGVSRKTVQRTMKEAEEFGWVTKRSKRANDWQAGEKALQNRTATKSSGYISENFPIMYYASSVKSHTPDFLYGENVLLSAGVAWRETGAKFTLAVPDANHLIVDSGGYQAATYFRDEYPYSPKELHEWAENIQADVVWGMDWACEDASVLSENTGVKEEKIPSWEWRLKQSWKDQVKQFNEHIEGRYSHEFRPVIQGHEKKQFVKFAEKLKHSDLPTNRVGVGTVCKRKGSDEIYEIVKVIKDVLPDSKLHLFGATLHVWNDERFKGMFHSSDTAAWIRYDDESGMFPSNGDEEALKRAFNNFKEHKEDTYLDKQKS